MTVLGNEVVKQVERVRRNTVGDLLTRTAARYPHKEAMVYKDVRLTYHELDKAVTETVLVLRRDGVLGGDRVAVLSKNSLDFVLLTFALARLGAVIVPINYMLTAAEVAYILGHSGATGAACAPEFIQTMEKAALQSNTLLKVRYVMNSDARPTDTKWSSLSLERQTIELAEPHFTCTDAEVYDDDAVQILYTSGTESQPKGVVLTHRNVISQYVSCIIDGGMASEDITIHALPMYHSAQLNCFLGPSTYLGGTGIILDQANPEAILRTVEEERITSLFCPPTVWIALLRHPDFSSRDLSSLRKCYYGAAIMPKEVLKELSERLPQAAFWNFYGQTEVAPLATILKPEDQLRKLGSAGRPALNVETCIMGEDGRILPPGEVGEIVHRTAHAMKGYLDAPEKTAEAFQGGWFHSGDLGVMDEEGYLTVVDRKKDMIKTGGVNVSSREVEEVIYQHPVVSEVAVVGVSDAYWIEAVTAIVVVKTGYASVPSEDILDFCKERLAPFKVPKRVVFIDALPKNPSGKILKRELRNLANEA